MTNLIQEAPLGKIWTPVLDACWTYQVWRAGTPKNARPGAPAQYNVGGLINIEEAKADADFTRLSRLVVRSAVNKMGARALTERDGRKVLAIRNHGIVNGNTRDGDQYQGNYIINAKRPEKEGAPVVYDPDGEVLKEDPTEEWVYPGAKIRLLVNPYAWATGDGGVHLWLTAIQVVDAGADRAVNKQYRDETADVAVAAAAVAATSSPQPEDIPPPDSYDPIPDEDFDW